MSVAAPGSTCRIGYDLGPEWDGAPPEDGDLLRSQGGSWYRIDDVRRSPKVPGRFYLRCTRLGRDVEPGLGTPVWPIFWHRRDRR